MAVTVGQFVAGMSYTMSIKLLSIYTWVRCFVYLLPLHSFEIPFAHNITDAVHLYLIYCSVYRLPHPTFYVVIIFAFVIGFTSAGVLCKLA